MSRILEFTISEESVSEQKICTIMLHVLVLQLLTVINKYPSFTLTFKQI